MLAAYVKSHFSSRNVFRLVFVDSITNDVQPGICSAKPSSSMHWFSHSMRNKENKLFMSTITDFCTVSQPQVDTFQHFMITTTTESHAYLKTKRLLCMQFTVDVSRYCAMYTRQLAVLEYINTDAINRHTKVSGLQLLIMALANVGESVLA